MMAARIVTEQLAEEGSGHFRMHRCGGALPRGNRYNSQLRVNDRPLYAYLLEFVGAVDSAVFASSKLSYAFSWESPGPSLCVHAEISP